MNLDAEAYLFFITMPKIENEINSLVSIIKVEPAKFQEVCDQNSSQYADDVLRLKANM